MERALAWINATITTLLIGYVVWLVHIANKAAEVAERTWGRNVDSGVIVYFFVAVYIAPTAALFAIAAVFMSRRWRGRWIAQALAVLWVIGSVLSIVFERELHAL